MKIIIMGDVRRYDRYAPKNLSREMFELTVLARDAKAEEIPEDALDAEVLFADAVSAVDQSIIQRLPKLKMIHSEGVAYNRIDIEAARKRGIYVCNNKGANAKGVAEQAVYLMLCLLRNGVNGDRLVREGKQIQTKEAWMVQGIKELGDCKVGLIGMGDIAQETARMLQCFGCEVVYWNRTRKSEELEKTLGIQYEELDTLLPSCDIVSLHLAVTGETTHIVEKKWFAAMKEGAFLINTARGELIDHAALAEALLSGKIGGAGLDTVEPEPVTADNILFTLPAAIQERIVFSPHIGGVTASSFYRMHEGMWNNAKRIAEGKRPIHIVNGL